MDKDEPTIRVRQETVITLICSITLAFIAGLVIATGLMASTIPSGVCGP